MTETTDAFWAAVDQEIIGWITEDDETVKLTDEVMADLLNQNDAVKLCNLIGLKRRIGKVMKGKGYTKVASNPPTWVKEAPKPIITRPEIPQYVTDTYLSLLQAQAVIERAFPGIEKAVMP